MQIRQSVLESMKWEYATRDDGTDVRFAVHNNELIAQERITFAENSRRRLMKKALEGEYDLTDIEVKGTGNSYLVIGWRETSLLPDFEALFPDLAA